MIHFASPYERPAPGTLRHTIEGGLENIARDGGISKAQLELYRGRMWREGIRPDLRAELASIFARDRDAVRAKRESRQTSRAELQRAMAEVDVEILAKRGEEWSVVKEALEDMNQTVRRTTNDIVSEKSPDSLPNLFAEAARHHDAGEHRRLLDQTLRGEPPPPAGPYYQRESNN